MAGDFSISGVIDGDASGFVDAVESAKSSLSSFAEVAAGVMAGMGAGQLFGDLFSGLGNLSSMIVGTASDFQSYGQTFTNTLSNLSQESDSTGDTMSGAMAKAAVSSLEAQDALIKYNEKVTELNNNIADVMQGQNIIDAQTAMYQKLDDLAQQHTDKLETLNDEIDQANQDLADREAQRQQSMDNSLQDMTDSHNDSVAKTTLEYQQKISETNSAVAKAALEKQLNDKIALMNEEFQIDYKTKQDELQRNLQQQDAADQQATDNKISKFQDEINKENTLYDDQVQKVQDDEAKKVATYQEENDKKLAMYKQELADEERAYQLTKAREAATAASGGGGVGKGAFSFGALTEMQKGQEFFTDINESASQLEYHLVNIAQSQPFSLHDIESASQGFAALGLNVEKTEPIVADLAGHWHQSIATASQAIQDEIAGNGRMLAYDFHITKDELEQAFGGKPITNVNDLMVAFQNLDENAKLRGSFKGGTMVAMQTLPGQASNLQDHLDKLMLSFMGISTSAKDFGTVEKGGLFDILLTNLTKLNTFLSTHQQEIQDFLNKVGKIIVIVIKGIADVVGFLIAHGDAIKTILIGLGIVLAIAFGPAILAAIGGFIEAMAIMAVKVLAWAVIGTVIKGVADNIVKWFSQDIPNAFHAFVDGWQKSFQITGQQISELGTRVNKTLTAVKNGFTDTKNQVLNAVQQFVDGWQKSFSITGQRFSDFGTLVRNTITTAVDTVKNAISDLAHIIGDKINDIMSSLGKLKDFAKDALSYLNPFAKHSPALVDQVNSGVEQIKNAYMSLQNLQINTPTLGAGGSGGIVNNTTNSPIINQNNSFTLQGEASASNLAEYLAFQYQHKGIV